MMRRQIHFLYPACFGAILFWLAGAQDCSNQLVNDQALQDAIDIDNIMARAKTMVDIALSSPSFDVEVDTVGHNKTLDYIEEQLRSLGDYYDVEIQEHSLEVERDRTTFAVNDVNFTVYQVVYSPEIHLVDLPVHILQFTGCNASDWPEETSGAIVLHQRGGCLPDQKQAMARAANATALVAYGDTSLSGPMYGLTLGAPNTSWIPTAGLSYLDYTLLNDRYQRGEELVASLDVVNRFNETVNTRNIIATTRQQCGSLDNNTSSTPQEVLVLSCPTDGTKDTPAGNNAAAHIAACLELAAQMAKAQWKTSPGVAVRFLFDAPNLIMDDSAKGVRAYLDAQTPAQRAAIRLHQRVEHIASPNWVLALDDGDNSTGGMSFTLPQGAAQIQTVLADWLRGRGQAFEEFAPDYGTPWNDYGIPAGTISTGWFWNKTAADVAAFGGTVGWTDPNWGLPYDNYSNINPTPLEIIIKANAHAMAYYAVNGFQSLSGNVSNSTSGGASVATASVATASVRFVMLTSLAAWFVL